MWRRLSVITGLLALSALVCAAVLPSRIRSLNRAFGIESVVEVHRFLGVASGGAGARSPRLRRRRGPRQRLAADPARGTPRSSGGHGRDGGPAGAHRAGPVPQAPGSGSTSSGARCTSHSPSPCWCSRRCTSGCSTSWCATRLMRLAAGASWPLVAGTVLAYRWAWRTLLDPSDRVHRPRGARARTRRSARWCWSPRRPADGWPKGTWAFAPGQFAWIRLERSVAAEEHPFTIASSAHDETTEFTIRHAGDFTRAIRRLAPGSPVWVDGPHGAFTSDAGDERRLRAGRGRGRHHPDDEHAAHGGPPRRHPALPAAWWSRAAPSDLLFRDELADLRWLARPRGHRGAAQAPPTSWTGHTGDIDVGLLVDGPPGHRAARATSTTSSAVRRLWSPTPWSALDTLAVPQARVHTEQFDLA